jgi:hypothetical protein
LNWEKRCVQHLLTVGSLFESGPGAFEPPSLLEEKRGAPPMGRLGGEAARAISAARAASRFLS